MKRLLMSIALAALTFGASQAQSLKFGHLDSEELIQSMPDMKNVEQQLEEQQKAVESQLTSLNEEFQRLMNDYETQMKGGLLSDEDATKKETELQEMYGKIQTYRQTAIQELQSKQQELMMPIITRVRRVIAEVGAENDFTYIFDITTGAISSIGKQSIDVAPLVKSKLGIN